jgi:glutathione S-transferase
MPLPILTYFSSRGRAELIRLVCAEAGVAYTERRLGVYHPVQRTPEFDALRATGILPFDAVPLWEEPDGFRLAQSDAIVRHIARGHGLYGENPRDAARCDMVYAGVDDARTEMRKLVTTDAAARPALREDLVTRTLPRWLGYFEKLLAHGGHTTIAGAKTTFADVALFLLFENIRDNDLTASYSRCPLLSAHAERTGARPAIARYVASPERFPIQLLPGGKSS